MSARRGRVAQVSRARHASAPRLAPRRRVRYFKGIPIGIGGSLTAPPLPHHRTCGSAYGGSRTFALDGPSFGSPPPHRGFPPPTLLSGFTPSPPAEPTPSSFAGPWPSTRAPAFPFPTTC